MLENLPESDKPQIFGFTSLVILPIIVILLLVGIFFWKFYGFGNLTNITNSGKRLLNWNQENSTTALSSGQAVNNPKTFEFQEITIPDLRARTYQSKLGGLEIFSEGPNYTSYLTSYDSDGYRINGFLTIPKGGSAGEKFPAIVFVHGYIPPTLYKTTVNYISYVDYLAKNGFVVFKIDLRGHDESEGGAGGAYYSDDYVVDTLNAVDALKKSDFVDPGAVGLWGHSMAGNVTFRSFVVAKNIPAIVIWAGAGYTYTDLQDYMINDNSYQPQPTGTQRARDRQRLRDAYGDFDPENWFWKQVPATNYLDGVTGAIQLNHAVDDNVVSIDYSRNLMKVLDDSQIKHELNEYPIGGHNLTGSSFNQAMQKTVEFFKTNLP